MGAFDIIFDYVDKESFIKYFRLIVVVCGYIILRGIYQSYANKYHVKRQVAMDEKEKLEKPIKEAEEKKKQEESLKKEAETFGWGKKTRRDNKLKEAYIETQFNDLRQRHQSAYDAAEDHDIDDLLED